MQIVKIVVDEGLEGVVGILGARAAQRFVIADLPEELAEGIDVMGSLQTVEVIKRHAKLVVAVLCQRVAAVLGSRLVIEIENFRIGAFAVIVEDIVAQKKQRFAVKDKADLGGQKHKVVHCLQGEIQSVVRHDRMDVVGAEINDQLVAVAVKGGLRVAHDEQRIAGLILVVHADHVDQGGVVGVVHKGVVVHEDDLVVLIVDRHGIAVLALERNHAVVGAGLERVVVVGVQVGDEEGHQLYPFPDVNIGQIIHAVHKVEGEFLIECAVRRLAEIGLVSALFDGVVAGIGQRDLRRQNTGKDHRQR